MTIKNKDKTEIKTIVIGDSASIPRPSDPGLFIAWRLILLIVVGLLLFLIFREPIMQAVLSVSDNFLENNWPNLHKKFVSWAFDDNHYRDTFKVVVPAGVWTTFKVTSMGISIALILGLITALGRTSKILFLNVLASMYVESIRGIPLMVQLLFMYFGVAAIIKVPPTVAAIIALGICYGAYMGEVIRAGINSIDKGQREAAISSGFSELQTMRYVVLPQAFRTILPPIGNEFISLLKDSSLVTVLGIYDITHQASRYAGRHFSYFESFVMIALIYLLFTLTLSKLVSFMELRLSRYERH